MAVLQATKTRSIAEASGTAISNFQARKQVEEQVTEQATATMATLQTTQSQAIDQHQSFEMVQTLLLSSIGNLLWIRNIFPEQCFQRRDYKSVLNEFRSAQNVSDTESIGSDKSSSRGRSYPFMVLTRGKTRGADELLDLLNGVFEAIFKNILAALQLCIFADQANPANVLETYTFSFKYSIGVGTGYRRLAGMVFSGSDGRPITIKSVNAGLTNIVHQLIAVTTRMPDLPATRFLNFQLLYTNDCPRGYYPRGFYPSKSETVRAPDNELWRMEERNLGSMNAGFYNVGLRMSHLVAHSTDATNEVSDMEIPQVLEYARIMERFKATDHGAGRRSTQERSVVKTPSVEASTRTTTELPPHSVIDEDGLSPRNSKWVVSGNKSRSEQLSRNNRQSQHACQDEDLVQTQLLDPDFSRGEDFLSWVLLNEKQKEMVEKRQQRLIGDLDIIDAHKVQCQCGYKQEEGTMVQCSCCDTWQHHHCYGFGLKGPEKLHFCYHCLLYGSDQTRLDEMKRLAEFRRTLWIVYDQGFPRSPTAFSKMLLYDLTTTKQLIQRLRDEGYLSSSKDSKRLKLVESDEQMSTKERIYSNPMTLISHLYIPPKNIQIPLSQVHPSPRLGEKETGSGVATLTSSEDETDELINISDESVVKAPSRFVDPPKMLGKRKR